MYVCMHVSASVIYDLLLIGLHHRNITHTKPGHIGGHSGNKSAKTANFAFKPNILTYTYIFYRPGHTHIQTPASASFDGYSPYNVLSTFTLTPAAARLTNNFNKQSPHLDA